MHMAWSNRIDSKLYERCLQLIYFWGDFIPQGIFLEVKPWNQNNLKDLQGLKLLLSFQWLSWH